jgi:hypothetical protein
MNSFVRSSVLCAVHGCASPPAAPPLLPGELAPPCTLAPRRSFLITSMTIPQDLRISLSDPPNGNADTLEFPYSELTCFGNPLPDAIARAFQPPQHILWVISTEACESGSDAFARVWLQRGLTVTDTAPLQTVTLADDEAIPAVGTRSGDMYDVAHGIGVAPIGLAADMAADTSPTDWVTGYNVTAHLSFTGAHSIEGEMGLAANVAASAPAVAASLARTLNIAMAADPGCPTSCADPWLKELVDRFDPHAATTIAASDITNSALESINFGPWIDLLAPVSGELVYWPDHDHVDDSIGTPYRYSATEILTQ